MADSKPIINMSIAEVAAFADRLGGGGGDTLTAEVAALCADQQMAAKIIRALSKAWHGSDLIRLDP
jgi:hypothetical protein